jgi:hypothetical protein
MQITDNIPHSPGLCCASVGVPGGMAKVPASVTDGSVGYSSIYGSWQGSS